MLVHECPNFSVLNSLRATSIEIHRFIRPRQTVCACQNPLICTKFYSGLLKKFAQKVGMPLLRKIHREYLMVKRSLLSTGEAGTIPKIPTVAHLTLCSAEPSRHPGKQGTVWGQRSRRIPQGTAYVHDCPAGQHASPSQVHERPPELELAPSTVWPGATFPLLQIAGTPTPSQVDAAFSFSAHDPLLLNSMLSTCMAFYQEQASAVSGMRCLQSRAPQLLAAYLSYTELVLCNPQAHTCYRLEKAAFYLRSLACISAS